MSYLDQLRQTVEQHKREEIQKQQQLEQQRQKFYTEVTPVLNQIHDYFAEIIQYLNYIDPDNVINYPLKGYGSLEDLSQKNYRLVTYRDIKALKQKNYASQVDAEDEFLTQSGGFFLRCECVGRHKIHLEKRKHLEMNLQREYFFKHNIEFNCEEQTDSRHKFLRAVFTVKPIIRVEFAFLSNLDDCSIDLVVTNFKQLGEQVYTLTPQAVDTAFLDQLAQYITHQPTDLVLAQKNQRKKTPLSAKQKDTLEFDLWLQQQRREQGSDIPAVTPKTPVNEKDFDEFNHWLQHQESQLKNDVPSQKQSFFQTFFSRIKKA